MHQEMKIHAAGDVANGWRVKIEDGTNIETWTPPAAHIGDAVTTAIVDHIAKFGRNVGAKAPPRSGEDQAEMDQLTKDRDDARGQLADAKKALADAEAKLKSAPGPVSAASGSASSSAAGAAASVKSGG